MLTENQKIAHLLRRFALGASEAEMNFYGKNGLKGAIDLLLNYASVPSVVEFNSSIFANKNGQVNMRIAQIIWTMRTVCTTRPLEEKMTLFWHNHFAISNVKVENGAAFLNHIEVLRENATGTFKDLLYAVTKDPAMLYWLDNQLNQAGKPNENFSREVMELFTIGIGNYSEKDVRETARAFTGWRYGIARRPNPGSPNRRDKFMFVASQHDDGEKEIFGKRANFNGEEVLDILCENPLTAKLITKKAWEWFAYENPEPLLIDRISKKFYDSGLKIDVLLRQIMEAPEFYGETSYRRNIKNPVDFCASTIRQLGVGAQVIERLTVAATSEVRNEVGAIPEVLRSIVPCTAMMQSATAMGMEIMAPPDVSGWRTGAYWVTSATMVERVKWADRLYVPTYSRPLPGATPKRRTPMVGYDAWKILFDVASPAEAVKVLLSVFDVEFPAEKQAQLVRVATKAVNGGPITRANANELARQVSRTIFASPEFQFG